MRPAEDAAFGTWAAELISKVLATGQFVPLRVKLMPKDLESVTEGLKRVRGTMMAPSPWEPQVGGDSAKSSSELCKELQGCRN
jgi:hypothetical protein